jgi:hypothetical protein
VPVKSHSAGIQNKRIFQPVRVWGSTSFVSVLSSSSLSSSSWMLGESVTYLALTHANMTGRKQSISPTDCDIDCVSMILQSATKCLSLLNICRDCPIVCSVLKRHSPQTTHRQVVRKGLCAEHQGLRNSLRIACPDNVRRCSNKKRAG